MLSLVVFIFGVFFGIFFFSNTVLPILYGFPRAILWSAQGLAKPHTPLLYLIAPVIWVVAFAGVVWFLDSLLPDAARKMMWNQFLTGGVSIGFAVALIRVIFLGSSRHDMNVDFLTFMAPYMTDRGLDLVSQKYGGFAALDHLSPEE